MSRQIKSWGPSRIGIICTGTPDWELTINENKYFICVDSQNSAGSILEWKSLKLNIGYIWSDLTWKTPQGKLYKLDGIANREARSLISCLKNAINTETRKRDFECALIDIFDWAVSAQKKIQAKLRSNGWVPQSFTRKLLTNKPQVQINFSDSDNLPLINSSSADEKKAIKLWQTDLKKVIEQCNQKKLEQVSSDLKYFFDAVESSPLTAEQIKAVVCMDDHTLLVASAGSGKTSTMVAKCGYAISQNYFKPEQVLMLAFNNDAAKELRKRIDARLKPLKIPTSKIVCKTFHAFGLEVIGLATGKKPIIPKLLENGNDAEAMLDLIDSLKDKGVSFRLQWDLFRIVIYRELPPFGEEENSPEWRDIEKNRTGFWTFNNELVKSRGELLIANWLAYNGVNYKYEAEYKYDTADATHTQYKPDFYFPDIELYYEHWAIDENGNPPKSFEGYRESIRWKRALHKAKKLNLLKLLWLSFGLVRPLISLKESYLYEVSN